MATLRHADLLRHLAAEHGLHVSAVEELDKDVLHVSARGERERIVRVFPAQRPLAAVEGDAEILRLLAEDGYPAERPDAHPVSVVAGRPLLVTEYVVPVPRSERREAIRDAGGLRELGRMLAGLQLLTPRGAMTRPGGAWHHFVEGRPADELAAASRFLEGAGTDDAASLDTLRRELAEADAGDGLPEAFLHPDFVLPNVVAAADGGIVLVDWTGAGVGPRIWPLAFLLWAEGVKDPRRAALVAAGYRERIALEPAELDRLPAMMRARHLVFLAWNLRARRTDPRKAAVSALRNRAATDAVAAQVIGILGAPLPPGDPRT
ncbi:phosphotransferase enzyme family protein [Leifsonia shinshuensis]|nr:phosphotransferase [Leifsonia shinshuensis]